MTLKPDDIRRLTVVSQTEFVINGLRNADVREALGGDDPTDAVERRRRSSQVSRQCNHQRINKTRRINARKKTRNPQRVVRGPLEK